MFVMYYRSVRAIHTYKLYDWTVCFSHNVELHVEFSMQQISFSPPSLTHTFNYFISPNQYIILVIN